MWVAKEELHKYWTPEELRRDGFKKAGSGKVPEGAEVRYGPTSKKSGGPGRRAKWWMGRWVKVKSNPKRGRTISKAVTSLIPSKYIPAKVRRDPQTGKIKIAIQPSKLKRSTRTRK